MKKLSIIFSLFIVTSFFLTAQDYSNNYGKCTLDELRMKSFPKDSIAEAAVIYDIGRSYFSPGGDGQLKLYFERTTKIKIFKKAGFKYSELEIPLYIGKQDIEEVYDIEGNTYNLENGSITTTPLIIEKKLVEKVNENWIIRKVAMPNIKEGSVIEISYKIVSPYLFNLRSWDFQEKIPIVYSEYRTSLNPFYEYIYILQGASNLSSFKSFIEPINDHKFAGVTYKDMIYEFVMKDVPAFRDETYISSIDDYKIKLNFQLSAIHYPNGGTEKVMSTWPLLIDDLLSEDKFGDYLNSAIKKSKSIVDTMRFESTNPEERARKIEQFVKTNFSWDSRISKFANKNTKEFLKSKIGNTAEINLFFLGMLKNAGIEAYPTLISTRGNGKINSNYPFLHFFDNVIVLAKIGDEFTTLDATNPLANFKEIPVYCFNDQGLVMDKKNPSWLSLTNTIESKKSYNIDIKINLATDELLNKYIFEAKGYDALSLRNLYANDIKKFKEDILPIDYNLIDSITTENSSQINKPLHISFGTKSSIEKIENKLIITPFGNTSFTENPFKQISRSYPIDMIYKQQKEYSTIIHIPAGYKLFSKFTNFNFQNEIGSINISSNELDKHSLKITAHYSFLKDIYQPNEYDNIKAFFNIIINKFNEKVILVVE